MQDQTQLPATAEPVFNAFHADISMIPAFTPNEMPRALVSLEDIVEQYG